MTDIVDRLRSRNGSTVGFGIGPVCDEAAALITRLRAEAEAAADRLRSELEAAKKDAGYWRAYIGTLSASEADELADRLDAEMAKG